MSNKDHQAKILAELLTKHHVVYCVARDAASSHFHVFGKKKKVFFFISVILSPL